MRNECSRTILIVEDDAEIRACVAEILDDAGFHVCAAANGREALECLRAGGYPCLILLDLWMPEMDGFCFREQQLADAALAQIPVVVMSADSRVETLAAELRAHSVLRKPVRLDDIINVVTTICG